MRMATRCILLVISLRSSQNTEFLNHDSSEQTSCLPIYSNSFSIPFITNTDVGYGGWLRNKKNSSTDDIPSSIFKGLRNLLVVPVSHIFNLSLKCGIYPTDWKIIHVVSVHKGGATNKISNYRPIALIPTIAKIFDNVLYHHFFSHLKTPLPSWQNGFVPKRDVSSNLLLFTEYALQAIEQNKQVDAIYFNLSKAFNSVNQQLLVQKLQIYGVADKILSLLKAYITGRPCHVEYHNRYSISYKPKSWVPQGSVLGPLLFNI